ncbi:ribosome silencing factor [Desulfovibrio litoralis]|uniref:Ribosomal silencing factor RsfS n=1 Tax=Desulfovibrio litoralis DSM 11393 TaxID=1121455 RepID=A0A1M7T8D6_9BACT|nr:ribosome silencing factor [Desulfovibrio litoralis]SHN67005.1 ribosome-associated protein [Desulfovibrio litoralis DSM 11393]
MMIEKPKKYSLLPSVEKTQFILDWMREKKAQELVAIDLKSVTQKQSLAFETIVILSANSIRHAQGLADYLLECAGKEGFEYFRMEGYQSGTWILLDLNDIIVNIFQPEERELYRLEDLWGNAEFICDERAG